MSINLDELERALTQFRIDIISALAEIDVEIDALQTATLEDRSLTKDRLKELRNDSRLRLHRFHEFHAQRISSPFEIR